MKILVLMAVLMQSLPDGPGKDVTQSVCSLCHDAASAVLGKQWNKDEWERKVIEMLQEEPDVTREERTAIVEYLSTFFRPGGKIYINKSVAKVLEGALEISSEAANAIVRFRDRNGDFKSPDDLKKVPGVDAARVERKKDLLIF